MKWEYRVVFVEINNQGFNAGMRHLNEAGDEGWEAVGVTESQGSLSVLLKRPVPSHPTPVELSAS